MKKRNSRKRVNTTKSRSDLMLRNMLRSLLTHGKVETTTARAKIFKRYVDRELNYCLNLSSERDKNVLMARVGDAKSVDLLMLFREYVEKKKIDRGTGWVNVEKTRFRMGDNAELSEVRLISADDYLEFLASKAPKKKKKKKSRKPATKETDTKKTKKSEDKKDEKEKKPSKKKQRKPDLGDAPDGKPPEKQKGFLSNLGGRILGRKVKGPEVGGKKGRSTARSGI